MVANGGWPRSAWGTLGRGSAWRFLAWRDPAAIGIGCWKFARVTDTLVIDDEGVYDPGAHNDRLLLGFKGSMSEAELHWLKSRLQGGKMTKAEQGQLRFRLPIGLVYDPVGRIVLDPDEAVQEVVRLVFSLFEQSTSALAVVSAFARQHLRFPTR